MLEKARVLACDHRVDKKRRDFVQRHLQPIRTREPAVNFSIDVEDRVALRHVAHLLHVEGLRPDGVERQDGEERRERQRQQGEFPPDPEFAPAFLVRGAREKLHR